MNRFSLINYTLNSILVLRVLISYDKKKKPSQIKSSIIVREGKNPGHLYFTLDGSTYHNRRIAGNYHVDLRNIGNLLLKMQESNLERI